MNINKNKQSISQRQRIRKYIRSIRNSLTLSDQYTAAQLIAVKAISINHILQAKKIATYFAFDGEINTNILIKKLLLMNKKIYLPILPTSKNQKLSFVQYKFSTPLIRNHFNIYEPNKYKNSTVSMKSLDIIFIPLVAFDCYGNRLGMGGGLYDKTLQNWRSELRCTLIGLGYDFQKIPIHILPIEKWDIILPEIITPSYYCKQNYTNKN